MFLIDKTYLHTDFSKLKHTRKEMNVLKMLNICCFSVKRENQQLMRAGTESTTGSGTHTWCQRHRRQMMLLDHHIGPRLGQNHCLIRRREQRCC